LLLANGASVHATNWTERTPLHSATSSEVVILLLDSGAHVEARDSYGRTPLYYLAIKGSTVAVQALLHRGAAASARDSEQSTPLHHADNSEVTTELLRYDADVEARDNDGETPLYHACRYNRVTSVDGFIAAGAQVDITNNAGDTPLHATAFYTGSESTTEVITALVAAGARLDIMNNEGKTAYDIACAAERDDDVLNLLRPPAARNSAVPVKTTNNEVNEVLAPNSAVIVAPVAVDLTAAAAAVAMSSSSVNDAIKNTVTTQSSHTVPITPKPASSSDVKVLDTWLCKWLIEIGFDETDACMYTVEMTKLKCYKAVALAALTEVKATKLATAAGVSEFEIDMFIEGWQQLKLTHQLTISTATSESVTPVTSPPVSPVAAHASVSNNRPQSPMSLVSDPILRYTDRHIMTGSVSSSVLTTIYQAVDHNTRRAVVLKRSPLSMTIAAHVSYDSLYMYCRSTFLFMLTCIILL
jgi:ankyrin repeat protein